LIKKERKKFIVLLKIELDYINRVNYINFLYNEEFDPGSG